ncbi:hypothetical protein TL16_g11345 [Triparma laevis f. inornata]|uniref:Transmembrane protein n=1 Tax=Triparma laevis f. inornata TaxID=1714386 RepID=A0A9W7BDJ7_9STRA|nr:hypothetical protein TL16_g11345 [Triparma laevis f. inornata]
MLKSLLSVFLLFLASTTTTSFLNPPQSIVHRHRIISSKNRRIISSFSEDDEPNTTNDDTRINKVGGRVQKSPPLPPSDPDSDPFQLKQMFPPLLLLSVIIYNLLPHSTGVKFYSESYSATYSNGNLIKEKRDVKTNVDSVEKVKRDFFGL